MAGPRRLTQAKRSEFLADLDQDPDARDGVVAALVAYILWGVTPLYFIIVSDVASIEVLLHRIVWAAPFGALIIHFRGQWPEVRKAFTHRSTLLFLGTSAFFIAINWLVYIYVVQHDQVFQASLGYYISPLVYMLVGMTLLHEKLQRLQLIAAMLATVGVLVLTFSGGQFPLAALVIAFTWTVYGVIRKQVAIGGMPGLFVETLLLLPIAVIWLGLMLRSGQAAFGPDDPGQAILLLLAGPVTIIPLLCFVLAARRLNLATIGFIQFLAPTLQFCIGVYYGEQLTTAHLICFACIWVAVILFSADALRANRRRPKAPAD